MEFSRVEQKKKGRNGPNRIGTITLISFFGIYAGIHAYLLRWTCDDAFISFRYAKNAAQGLGLVFNSGERVEGFTNFLWTAFLIPAIGLGASPVYSSWVLSLFSMLGLFLFLGHRQYQYGNQRHWPLLLAGLLSVTLHFLVFATSGLETMAFSVTAFLGLYFSLGGDRIDQPNDPTRGNLKDQWSLPIGLFILVITCLLRPDGLIFYSVAWASGCLRILRRGGGPPIGNALALLASLTLLGLYEIGRYQYYGAWLPNTFYAKSAYSSYAGQGLKYMALFYQSYWFWPVAAVALLIPRRKKLPSPWGAMLLAVVLWHSYVLWVGGDFMFGRFLIPVLPILGFLIATSIDSRLPSNPRPSLVAPLAAVLCFFLGFLRYDPYARAMAAGDIPQISGIVDERLFYPRDKMQELSQLAASYRPVVRDSEVRLAFHGGAAFLIYYMDPFYALEASTGLTDARLARRRLDKRGRIGHEKEATLDYMQERNVNVYMWPPDAGLADRTIVFQGFWDNWQIVDYDPAVFQKLKKDPRIQFQFTGK